MDQPLPIEDVRRIEAKPGDRFVLTIKSRITHEQAQAIRRAWASLFDDGTPPPLLILDAGVSLSVISTGNDTEAVDTAAPLAASLGLAVDTSWCVPRLPSPLPRRERC